MLANIALSVLDEHFAGQWESLMGTEDRRWRRRRNGLGTWRLVRYADLCRARHKSAYAEVRVMPTRLVDALAGGLFAVVGSA